MKPAPFAYADPETVAEVLALLAEHGADSVLLAGGQSLVPDLNFRRRRPRLVIDLGRVTELSAIAASTTDTTSGGGDRRGLVVGAGVRVGELAAAHPDVAVAQAVACIGHPQIRSRTTVGGALAQAEPAGELPVVFAALDGVVTLASTSGERTVDAADWFVGRRVTQRRPDELVTAVTFDVLGGPTVWAEVSRRPQDLPIVGVFAGLGPDGWRVAAGGLDDVPVRARESEAALDAGDLDGAVAALDALVTPSDPLVSAAHRRSIARSLLRSVVGGIDLGVAA